ncbi:MAG TPA: MMPL family transporter, partial [Candidatus Polarisedimenticolaceae bacterium]|nr:MMPL family transporter [Candidatus Polarisedimenticolaceae bacterium]
GASRAGPGWLQVRIGRLVDGIVDAAAHHRLVVLGGAGLLTAVATWGATRVEFDASPRALRPVDHPAAELERVLADDFSLGLDGFTVIVHGPSLDVALGRADEAAVVLRDQLDRSAAVYSPADYLLSGALLDERIAAARRVIDESVPALLRDELRRRGFDLVPFSPALEVLDAIAAGRPLPDTAADRRPDWLDELVRVEHGTVWATVQVAGQTGQWPDGPPRRVLDALAERLPDATVASISLVGASLRRLVARELRVLSGWCFLIICAVVLVSFRLDVRSSALSLLPVSCGGLWVIGACGLVGIPISLFSVTAAPLLLGLGIDDGLHALHGIRFHGSLRRSLHSVGPAITITTLSTCLGFGSLMLSRLPALRSGGLVIALGTGLCLVATIVLLPAVWRDPAE